MALRDSINSLLRITQRDPESASLQEFMLSKLEEFDAAKAAIEENQRVQALMTPQPKED